MEKYKRFQKEFVIGSDMDTNIQKFYNDLTTEGWRIIYYNEKNIGNHENLFSSPKIIITVVCNKNDIYHG